MEQDQIDRIMATLDGMMDTISSLREEVTGGPAADSERGAEQESNVDDATSEVLDEKDPTDPKAIDNEDAGQEPDVIMDDPAKELKKKAAVAMLKKSL